MCNAKGNINMDLVKSIINQFRWLDQLNEPRDLLEQLVSLVEICPLKIQYEIIQTLPEIFIDIDQTDLLERLTSLASKNSDLFVPVIECLGALNIPTDDLDYTVELVINRLNSIDIENLATAVQFLLASSNEENLLKMLQSIREKIKIDQILKFQINKSNMETSNLNRVDNNKANKSQSCSMILDTINSSLLINNQLKNSWIRTIESIYKQHSIYILDILALGMMHSIPAMKKKVKETIKSKVSVGVITPNLIQDTIENYLQLIQKSTIDFLSIAEYLNREAKTDHQLGDMSVKLYTLIFLHSDIFFRQETVGSIITHIGSGNKWEIDYALEALDKITKEDSIGLSQFLIFIQGILDYLDKLSLSQIAKLFEIYASLSIVEKADMSEGVFYNELNIVIRKQLTHPSEKYKVIGITACISMIKQMNKLYKNELENSTLLGSSKNTMDSKNYPIYLRIISILQLIQTVCPKYHSSLSLTCNQLAEIIISQELHLNIVEWLFDNFAITFCDLFLFVKSDDTNKFTLMPTWPKSFNIVVWDDLNETEGDLAINILPTVISYYYNPRESIHPDLVCSLFKLYQACEYYLKKNLDEIGSLLLCGILMFNKENLDDIMYTGETGLVDCLTISLIIASNWYRELINAFCQFSDPFIQSKIKERLSGLVALEDTLSKFMLNRQHLAYTGFFLEYNNSKQNLHNISPIEARKFLHPLDFQITKFIFPKELPENVEEYPQLQLGKEECNYILDNFKIKLQQSFSESELNLNTNFKVNYQEILPIINGLCNYLKLVVYTLSIEDEIEDNEEISLSLDCLQILKEQSHLFKKESKIINSKIYQELSSLTKYVMNFNLSLKIQKLLSIIYKENPNQFKKNNQIFDYIKQINSKKLGTRYSVKNKEALIYLLKEEFYYSENRLEILKYYLNNLLEPVTQDNTELIEANFPNFNIAMLPIYYKIISSQLIELTNSIQIEENIEDQGVIKFITILLDLWHKLINIATKYSDHALLLTTIQYGRQFVDNFIKTILPFLDYYLPHHRQKVLFILKNTQLSTRKLQNICNEIKTKGKALASAVPSCRASLEKLILQVRKLFKEHNVLDAYDIGNLKHRAIDGNLISSQYQNEDILSQNESSLDEEVEINVLPSKKKRGKVPFGGKKSKKNKEAQVENRANEESGENEENSNQSGDNNDIVGFYDDEE
ncbi:hypothetical protein K502DRAFT_303327 [Neoconidiobolus thromboides FSU 785]|nr:hypothetical protein K502DRAFT_303327 [Neoconidiobolus thromboides FSU 785]